MAINGGMVRLGLIWSDSKFQICKNFSRPITYCLSIVIELAKGVAKNCLNAQLPLIM
jgi:hypothetical protein